MKAEATIRREIQRLEQVARADGYTEAQAGAAISMQMALAWVIEDRSRPPFGYFRKPEAAQPQQEPTR